MAWIIILFVFGNTVALTSLSVGLYYQHRISKRLMAINEIYRRWLEGHERRLEMQSERLDDHWTVIMKRMPQPHLFSGSSGGVGMDD